MNRPHRADVRLVRWVVPFTVILLTTLFAGCESDDPVDPPSAPSLEAPQIDSVNVPTFWVYDSPDYRTISVAISFPPALEAAVKQQDVPAPNVFIIFESQDGIAPSVQFQLLDDGGGPTIPNPFDFMDNHSGDLVPLDLTYSLRINALFASSEGEVTMRVMAGWPLSSDSTTMTMLPPEILQVEINSAPVIESFVHSDSLYAGFEAEEWTARVDDADIPAGDAVEQVEVQLIRDGDTVRNLLMAKSSQRIWTFALEPTFAAGLPTAEYTINLTAIDRYDQPATPYESIVWFENSAPILSGLVAPDTVYRPEGDEPNPYNMFINVADLQGQGDIRRVDYIPVDPNGHIPDNLDPFFFNDLGDMPDEVANDGIFSHQFAVYPDASNFGTYTFTITAHDRAGNDSESIVHMIELPSSGGKR
ncbi:hypothetical protein KQI63_03345 [bacterium]|nr:hypothetical protein [bacterium]